jgi:hypothetical protein
MALQNNFIPNTSLVFTPRDYAQQIAQNQADDTRAVQNAFKFGTQFADWNTNSKIANELRKKNPNLQEIDALAASRINTPDTGASMWRWKKSLDELKAQRDAELARAEAEKEAQKEKAIQNLKYKIDAQLGTMEYGLNTSPEQKQQFINTLADLEEQGNSTGVGEEYMKKIWDKKALLRGEDPYNKVTKLVNDMDIADMQFDKVEDQGGFGKDVEKYKTRIDEIYNAIKDMYAAEGLPVPSNIEKAYNEKREKHNKKQPTQGTRPSRGRRR